MPAKDTAASTVVTLAEDNASLKSPMLPGVIDVEVEADEFHWRDFRRRAIATVIGFLSLGLLGWAVAGLVYLLSLQTLPPITRALIAVGVVILGIGIGIPFLLFCSRKLRSVFRTMRVACGMARPSGPWSDESANYLRENPMLGPMLMSDLVKTGQVGLIIRRSPRRRQDRIEPMKYPFEPVALNESDESFRELDDACGHVQRETSGDPGSDPSLLPRRRPPAFLLEVRRLAVAGTGATWLLIIFINLVPKLNTGSTRAAMTLAMILGFGICFIIYRIVFEASRRDWLLVPGGVVVYTEPLGKRTMQRRLLTRTSANLLLSWTPWAGFWAAHVAVRGGSYRCFLSTSESNMLLRGWLSNVSPPSVSALAEMGLIDIQP